MTLLLDIQDLKVTMATVFPPLLKQFSWVDSSTGNGGVALPAGEDPASVTLGIRPDGVAACLARHIPVPVVWPLLPRQRRAPQVAAAIGSALAPGNYWANALQTDTYNGASVPRRMGNDGGSVLQSLSLQSSRRRPRAWLSADLLAEGQGMVAGQLHTVQDLLLSLT